ncbi:MAG: exosortase A-associated hydrolase 1 [Paraglaciecola sp.]|jgi:exosortase A-associated hydrolase 1
MQQQHTMEHAVHFMAGGKQLIGVAHSAINACANIAVLILVGGPQTRVGSHRQFVLLSRYLAQNGYSSMRFDYAGMGDSDGVDADFMNVSDDIEQAIHTLKQHSGAAKIVIWGLCDAASSALIFARKKTCDDLAGMILLNPWVRSEQGEAKAIIKHYYLNRLKDRAFWAKVFSLKFDITSSVQSLSANLLKMSGKKADPQTRNEIKTTDENYIGHMLDGLKNFDKPIMLIISGDDLTASEFIDLSESSKDWKGVVEQKVSHRVTIAAANHTFSSQQWRHEVEAASLAWLQELNSLQ